MAGKINGTKIVASKNDFFVTLLINSRCNTRNILFMASSFHIRNEYIIHTWYALHETVDLHLVNN